MIETRARWAAAAIVGASFALLLLHARRFDFFADDAFISLRYAHNLARFGEPVYNLGERVEGYTSPLWMAVAALGLSLGADGVAFVEGAGLASGLLLLAASWLLWRQLEPRRLVGGAALLGLLAFSAPLAAWSVGGLETVLFAALTTLGLALAGRAARAFAPRSLALASLTLGLATLTRPEGALFFVIIAGVLMLVGRPIGGRARWLTAVVAPFTLVVGAHLVFRLSYYGQLLPNTFHVKSSGSGLASRGLQYLGFAAREMGWGLVLWCGAGLVVALVLVLRRRGDLEGSAGERARTVVLGTTALLAITYLPYIVSIGGDFLDLYRFLVPLFPPLFATAVFATQVVVIGAVEARSGRRAGWVAAAALAILGVGIHARTQGPLGTRALQVAEPERAKRALEPLGWTRLYARYWAAGGRWLAAHARPGDTMATGAAGAMPYYAGLPNLDLYGLNDAWIARHGRVIGNRPGHQRYATDEYILSRTPTFLFVVPDYVREEPGALNTPPKWARHGYVMVEAQVTQAFGAPGPFSLAFLATRARAEQLADVPGVRVDSRALGSRAGRRTR